MKTQVKLQAELFAQHDEQFQYKRIVKEGKRRQGWALDSKTTTLRVKQNKDCTTVFIGRRKVYDGDEDGAVKFLRQSISTLSLRKPLPSTIDFLLKNKLIVLHSIEGAKRGRKKQFNYTLELPPREKRIGFSEIAAVMGQSPYMSPLELWRIKAGLDNPKSESFAMRWGKETEGVALKIFTELMNAQKVRRHVKAADGVLAGEVDAIAKINDQWCVVEIKVASGRHAHHAYKLQVNAQLGALQLKKGYIFTVFGTHYSIDEIDFDPNLYSQQKEAAEAFIKSIQDNVPPLSKELLEAYNNDDLDSLDLSNEDNSETLSLLAELAQLEQQISEIENKRNALREQLKLAMTTAKLQTIKTNFAIAELKEVSQERLDTKALRQAHPDIASKFIKQTTYTTLKVKTLN